MALNFRIDDRLIHGQVITNWTRYYNLNEIIIVDDQVFADPIQRKIIEMVAPSNVSVRIFRVDEAFTKLKPTTLDTLVLVKSPDVLLQLHEHGLEINEIIVGGMQFREGKSKISSSVSLSQEEKKTFTILADKNIDIYIQMVPSEKKRKLVDLL